MGTISHVAAMKVAVARVRLRAPSRCIGICAAASDLIDADPQRSIMRLAARERALGGVAVLEDASEDALKTARRIASGGCW